MPVTLSQIVGQLLAGHVVAWEKAGAFEGGHIQLSTPASRRLFRFLLAQRGDALRDTNEALFPGLETAWSKESDDPAESGALSAPADVLHSWRLSLIETHGFGGLNSHGGPDFRLEVRGENWCLEGHNGSGKTSLVSAIIWAMQGLRLRDQDGLVSETGVREPVVDKDGKKVGTWPSVCSYPEQTAQLAEVAQIWVRLTFTNEEDETAVAYRQLVAPVIGDPQTTEAIDPRLLNRPELIETNLLMPARLSRIGFGNKSETLYDAVKVLTGLDKLGDVSEAASNLTHGAKRFLKFAKDQGIETEKAKHDQSLLRANSHITNTGFVFSLSGKLGDEGYAGVLETASKAAADSAAVKLTSLKADIADTLDIAKALDRANIKAAATLATGVIEAGKSLPIFAAWRALKAFGASGQAAQFLTSISEQEETLGIAEAWDKRQDEDQKFRLKALASSYYDNDTGPCPLCEGELLTREQKALAGDLIQLRHDAHAAERKLQDVCSQIRITLDGHLPPDLTPHLALLRQMQPKSAFATAILERYADDSPFSDILKGIGDFVRTAIDKISAPLPQFDWEAQAPAGGTKQPAQQCRSYIDELKRLCALAEWWTLNNSAFGGAWVAFQGSATATDPSGERSLLGKMRHLNEALDEAFPLDEISKALANAALAAKSWRDIQSKQDVRDDIANAVKSLKDLSKFVGAESVRSIGELSKKIDDIRARVHLTENLSYGKAEISKKVVEITGTFGSEMYFNASKVANTSWLRAMLWSFVIALREQTLEGLTTNPFPLVVLDDPQTTFDPKNKRKWAEELARSANLDPTDKNGTQLLITTHERQFFQFLVNVEQLSGEQGLLVRRDKTSKVAFVVDGTGITRAYNDAIASGDDEKGHKFVSNLRIYIEDLMKIMLRAEGPDIFNLNLDILEKYMKKLRANDVAPFNRPPFEKLLNSLGGGGGKALQLLNDSHHQFDGTIGIAQATLVKQFWNKPLEKEIHDAFKVFAQYESYSGEPRIFPWMDNVIEFPPSNSQQVKQLAFVETGIAAAAKTDGRAGDGLILLTDHSLTSSIKLHNHEIYQLAAQTLEPVVNVGDLLIASNYSKVTERNLVVATFEDRLLARRYNLSDLHPNICILTGQGLFPDSTPQPVIAPDDRLRPKRIIGTLFTGDLFSPPPVDQDHEIVGLTDLTPVTNFLKDAKLYRVSGRSAEPLALDGQYLIARDVMLSHSTLIAHDGKLVIAVDATGIRYFKRIHVREDIVILESLNSDAHTQPEILSLADDGKFPQLSNLLSVLGVLFELP